MYAIRNFSLIIGNTKNKKKYVVIQNVSKWEWLSSQVETALNESRLGTVGFLSVLLRITVLLTNFHRSETWPS